MQFLNSLPGSAWVSRHPRLAAWIVLSIGMAAIIIYEARDVGLLLTQWIALLAATTLVAGLCVFIVSWEDSSEPDEVVTAIDTVEVPVAAETPKDS